jgi:hypothetical protein
MISSIPSLASVLPVPTGVSSASGILGQNFTTFAQSHASSESTATYNVQALQGNVRIPWAVSKKGCSIERFLRLGIQTGVDTLAVSINQ